MILTIEDVSGQQHAIYRNEQQIQKLRDEIDQLQYEIELK
jgi:hypothetical protein